MYGIPTKWAKWKMCTGILNASRVFGTAFKDIRDALEGFEILYVMKP